MQENTLWYDFLKALILATECWNNLSSISVGEPDVKIQYLFNVNAVRQWFGQNYKLVKHTQRIKMFSGN